MTEQIIRPIDKLLKLLINAPDSDINPLVKVKIEALTGATIVLILGYPATPSSCC